MRKKGIRNSSACDPLSRIDSSLETLGGNRWSCTIDLISGYWQCKMAPQSKDRSAFNSHMGLFEFKVLPYGMCNAPATFQRLIKIVLRVFLWERCLCYIDDVIVFGETFEKTLENLELVFGRFRSANLKLKPNKCTLFQTEVLFLGHMVSNKGISYDPGKVASVENWPVPTTVTEVKSFLGLAGYYRKFIPNFSEIASSLTELTKKCKKFVWTDNCQTAFDRLVELLTSAPVLAFPKRTGEFIIDTDASANGIGAVLSQVQDGEERVIAYNSKTLNNDSQRKYCTTYRELLAVVVFVSRKIDYLL